MHTTTVKYELSFNKYVYRAVSFCICYKSLLLALKFIYM